MRRALVLLAILAPILLLVVSCEDHPIFPFVLRPPCIAPAEDLPSFYEADLVPAWSPTGNFIVYRTWPTTGGQVLGFYRIFLDEEGRRVGDSELLLDLTELGLAGEQRISPDGTKLAFWMLGDIWMLDLGTRDTTRITRVGDARWPDWHPDGEWLVYAQILGGSPLEPDSSGGMHIVNVNTLEDRQLTRKGGRPIYGGHPRWDAAGRSIIFFFGDAETRNASLEIFRVFPDSTDYIRLTRTGWGNQSPCWWYLHGEEVVFTPHELEYRNMEFVVNLSTGRIRCFSAGGRPTNVRAFDFSPDQTKLVTTRPDTTGTIGVLWVLDIPTGHWTQLTDPPL